jgi:hypothetical protein
MIRRVVVLLLTGVLYVPMVAHQTAQAACGVWRWPVKTLSDPARRAVDLDPIRPSVRRMRQRARPSTTFSTDTPRTSRTEFHTWELRARPIQAKLEDDSDVHLVNLRAPSCRRRAATAAGLRELRRRV